MEFDASAARLYTYGQTPNNIAYCGPYLVTNFTSKNIIVFSANETYWNKDNINIEDAYGHTRMVQIHLKIYNDLEISYR